MFTPSGRSTVTHMDGNEIDRRFWQHLSQEAPNTTLTGLKKEAFILFSALDSAYTNSSKMSGLVPVDRQLIQYLAGWAEESLKDSFHGSSVIGPDANHCLKRLRFWRVFGWRTLSLSRLNPPG